MNREKQNASKLHLFKSLLWRGPCILGAVSLCFLSIFFYNIVLWKKEGSLWAQNAKKNPNPIEKQAKKEPVALKSPLKELDKSISYPNGLYSGTFTIRFQESKKEKQKYNFRLYLKDKKRLYYFFDQSFRLVYKLLYYQYPNSELMILAWDPLREILRKKERKARFHRVLKSGFNYWDFSLQPYSSYYEILNKIPKEDFQKKDSEENTRQISKKEGFYSRDKKLKLSKKKEFPEDIALDSKDLVTYILKAKLLSPYLKVKAGLKKERIGRLDFYSPPGILKKSLYPSYASPLYDETQKKELYLKRIPTMIRSLDFERETLSSIKIEKYNSRAPLKAGLFNPRFIKN